MKQSPEIPEKYIVTLIHNAGIIKLTEYTRSALVNTISVFSEIYKSLFNKI